MLTAKTQRWAPEELLRTLVEAEIAARDASNTANRLKAAAFPVAKTLESFDLCASSIPQATFNYLASLEWIRVQHNLAIIGPPGTGKSHTLIGLGIAAVQAGHKSATSPRSTSSKPSTAAWPTTPSAKSSKPYCAQT